MQTDERQLKDLVSIGPATLDDFELLGIDSVAQLRIRNPQRMYQQLCRIKRRVIDTCCLDVFVAAVAQAKDPNLPIEQRRWWYWSKARRQQIKKRFKQSSDQLVTNYEALVVRSNRQMPLAFRKTPIDQYVTKKQGVAYTQMRMQWK